MISNKWQSIDIRWLAVAVSLLISALLIVFHATPNDDAWVYIRTAEIYTEQGLGAAFDHLPWATYPVLIGILHQAIGIDLLASAYLLNAFLFALLVYAFLSIVKEIDSSSRLMLLATICVLVYPQLNEYRHEVIRDIGFWAFCLLGVWKFMQFQDSLSLRHGAAFCLTLIAAATFRAEAIVYLALLPLCLLVNSRYDRGRRIQLGLGYTGAALIALLLILGIPSLFGINLVAMFTEFFSVYLPFLQDTFFPDEQRSLEIGRALFNEHAAYYSSEYLTLFMTFGLIAILIPNIFNAIGGPFLLTLLAGVIKKHLLLPRPQTTPLLFVVAINLVILAAFLFVTRFLTSRYAMMLALMLAIFVPFVLNRFLPSGELSGTSWRVRLVVLLMVYCAVDAYISFGENKDYIYEAVDWINANADADTQLITNNQLIAYGSQRIDAYDQITRNLTEEQIIQAGAGTLFAIENNTEMQRLLAEDHVSGDLETLLILPDEQNQELIIFQKTTNGTR